MTDAEYLAMQQRVELLSRLLLDTDPAALEEFVQMGEHSSVVAAVIDPTAWIRGHDALRMVIEHARAIARARRSIAEAAELAGAAR